MGDPPAEGKHEWKAVWDGEHVFRNLKYRCVRCGIGPFTASSLVVKVSRSCYSRGY